MAKSTCSLASTASSSSASISSSASCSSSSSSGSTSSKAHGNSKALGPRSSSSSSGIDRRKRLAANARERKRMNLLNKAYDELRRRLVDAENKSKYDILVQAKEYIQALAAICEKFDNQQSPTNGQEPTPQQQLGSPTNHQIALAEDVKPRVAQSPTFMGHHLSSPRSDAHQPHHSQSPTASQSMNRPVESPISNRSQSSPMNMSYHQLVEPMTFYQPKLEQPVHSPPIQPSFYTHVHNVQIPTTSPPKPIMHHQTYNPISFT